MRRWLITGVSSGIGAALARAALDLGDAVVGTVRDDDARAAFEQLAPGRAQALLLDLADHAAIGPAMARALAGGPVDILVNNAGRSLFGAFEETELEEARGLFETNLFGPWATMQATLPHLRARGAGTIVNVSSGCGLNASPALSAYSASKFALEGLTEAVAAEVARFGVRVMLVEPGAIATRFISHATQETATRLADYAFLSGQGKSGLDAYYATAALSPDRVAEAIIGALALPELPLRLVVGDMRPSIGRKAGELVAAAEAGAAAAQAS